MQNGVFSTIPVWPTTLQSPSSGRAGVCVTLLLPQVASGVEQRLQSIQDELKLERDMFRQKSDEVGKISTELKQVRPHRSTVNTQQWWVMSTSSDWLVSSHFVLLLSWLWLFLLISVLPKIIHIFYMNNTEPVGHFINTFQTVTIIFHVEYTFNSDLLNSCYTH